MRARRTALAGAIILSLLASLSLVVLAQDREAAVTSVTGVAVTETAVENEGRVVFEQVVDWSDPRLPATLRADANWGGYGVGPNTVMTVEMTVLLQDDDGSWRGNGRAVETADDRHSYYELTGEDAYQGLHALIRGTPGMDANGPWDEGYEGYIFEAELPLFPDPVESNGE